MTGLCVNTQEYHFTNYCLSFGGGWDSGKTIDTPENAAALQFIIDAYRQGYVVTPKELGVSYTSVNRWENGRSLPTKMTLLVIRRYCEEHHLEFSCEEVGRLS